MRRQMPKAPSFPFTFCISELTEIKTFIGINLAQCLYVACV